MASPETDSGFVGSETSRVSPLTQTPEHRLSHIRYPGPPPPHSPSASHMEGWVAWESRCREPQSRGRWSGHSQSPHLIPQPWFLTPILSIEGNQGAETGK